MTKRAVKMDAALFDFNLPFSIENQGNTCILTFSGMRKEICNMSAGRLLNEWCICYGSTASGRMEAFKRISNSKQKFAILISEVSGEMYIPLRSTNHKECIWLQASAIMEYKRLGPKLTRVIFFDHTEMTFAIDYRVIHKQMQRYKLFMEALEQNRGKCPKFI